MDIVIYIMSELLELKRELLGRPDLIVNLDQNKDLLTVYKDDDMISIQQTEEVFDISGNLINTEASSYDEVTKELRKVL